MIDLVFSAFLVLFRRGCGGGVDLFIEFFWVLVFVLYNWICGVVIGIKWNIYVI